MEKQDMIKIAAVVGVIVMAGSMFAVGTLDLSGIFGGNDAPKATAGMAMINGTIRTYDKMLVASPSEYNESDFDAARGEVGFKSLTHTADGWILETETRDDVYPIAAALRKNGVQTQAIANIALPGTIMVTFANGSEQEVGTRGQVVRVVMEPMLEADSEVSVQFIVSVQNGYLANIASAELMADEVNESVEASVSGMNYIEHTYSIPWVNRTSVDAAGMSEYGDAEYVRNDIVHFQRELTVDEVKSKKELPYITYIDMHSVQVSGDFTNSSQVESDFADAGPQFQPSVLKITSNETLDLAYDGRHLRSYRLLLPETIGSYELGEREFDIETENEYSQNDTLEVSFRGIAIGSRIVSVTSVLPS